MSWDKVGAGETTNWGQHKGKRLLIFRPAGEVDIQVSLDG